MSKRILMVEDTEDNRQIVRDLITSAGYELLEAQTVLPASRWRASTSRT